MSIEFISGKPGGGKSLYATKLVFDELRFGTRHIVTNLAIDVGRLNQYYQEHYDDPVNLYAFRLPSFLTWLFWFLPEWMVFKILPSALVPEPPKIPKQDDICNRITIITEDDLPVFFTFRPGSKIQHITNADWKAGKRPDYCVVKDSGVFYALDEVHIAFNARAWADTGAEVLYYLSQHRKLGDEVLCITQSVANVDKQFRSVAQAFTYLRNLGKEKWGKFRLPVRFVRKTYPQPPTEHSQPSDWGTFSLDVQGLASCYDTAKGVGIHGRSGADTHERKKGFHWGWFVVGTAALLVFAFHFVPDILAKVTSPPVTFRKKEHVDSRRLVQATSDDFLPSQSPPISPAPTNVRSNFPPPVTMTGFFYDGHNYQVFLSDGTELSTASDDGRVVKLHRRYVVWRDDDGQIYTNRLNKLTISHSAVVEDGQQKSPPVMRDQRASLIDGY